MSATVALSPSCSFLGSSTSVIDSQFLKQLQSVNTVNANGALPKIKRTRSTENLFPFVCLFDFSDPAECGVSVTEPRQRIVRGNKATSGVWPWQINIYWDGRHCWLSLMLGQVLVVHDPTPCRLYEYGYNVIYFNSILTFYFLSFVFLKKR